MRFCLQHFGENFKRTGGSMEKAANSSISLKNIKITDKFWNKYIHLVKDVIIPYK